MLCPLTPIDLHCEYLTTPLGIDPASSVHLSWRFTVPDQPSEGARQTAYRLLASSTLEGLNSDGEKLWDSGRVSSARNLEIAWQGPPLESMQRVYWTVQVWDENGTASPFAAPTWFETGLAAADWTPAQWIRPCYDSWPRPLPASYLRKNFSLNEPVVRARIYICGLGYHELFINGTKIGDRLLEPAQTDYEKEALYAVHDVTDALYEGDNAIGVILGNGWYNQDRVWTDGIDPVYGLPGVIAKMVMETASGERFILATDESWSASDGPVRQNNIYAGEHYDARLEMPGWNKPAGRKAPGWQPVTPAEPLAPRLIPQLMPPIRQTETVQPVGKHEVCPGVWVFDLGRNMAGWARIRLRGNPGQEICLRFSEVLFPDGSIDPASTGSIHTGVVQTDRYICHGSGAEEVWEPRFTYHGFQYVEVTGLQGEPPADFLVGVIVHTDLPAAGRFQCSDELLNRVHRTALWTVRGNLHGLPTDCPGREKCGWLGDAHLVTEVTLYNFEAVPFWRKYLRDIENGLGQGGETYLAEPADPRAPPNIVPGRRRCQQARPDWGVACVLIPWFLFRYTGDRTTLTRYYSMMQGWTRYFEEITKENIVEQGYGDWCPPGGNDRMECPVSLSSTAYYFFNLDIMATIAGELGETADREYYRQRADLVHQAFIRRFYDPEKKTYGSQTANALALFLRIFPEGDRDALAASLAHEVTVRHQGHFFTGVHGMNYLFRVLADHGYDDVVFQALHTDGFPGFKHFFSLGGTTLWEHFFQPRVHDLNATSRNHPMHASFDSWFYSGIAGIRPDPDFSGFTRVLLRPAMIQHLDWAEGEYISVQGKIRSVWRRRESVLEWEIELPGNTRARVCLPPCNEESITVNGERHKLSAPQNFRSGSPEIELTPGAWTLSMKTDSFNKY